jgi:hypothetical protein
MLIAGDAVLLPGQAPTTLTVAHHSLVAAERRREGSGRRPDSVGRRPGLRFGDRFDGSVVIIIGIGAVFLKWKL